MKGQFDHAEFINPKAKCELVTKLVDSESKDSQRSQIATVNCVVTIAKVFNFLMSIALYFTIFAIFAEMCYFPMHLYDACIYSRKMKSADHTEMGKKTINKIFVQSNYINSIVRTLAADITVVSSSDESEKEGIDVIEGEREVFPVQ